MFLKCKKKKKQDPKFTVFEAGLVINFLPTFAGRVS